MTTTIETTWKEILKDIHENGYLHKKDDSDIKEIIDVHKYIKNPAKNLVSKELGISLDPATASSYLHSISMGNYDIKGYPIKGSALHDYVASLNDVDEHGFVYTYPNRLQQHFLHNNGEDGFFINQLNSCINRLANNSGTNRAVGVLLDPEVDTYELDTDDVFVDDIPCWNWFQFLIRDNTLNLHIMFRSNDILHAFPSNMMLMTYMGMSVADKLREEIYPDLRFEGIYYNCTSAHYYTDVVNDKIIKEIL